MRGGRRHSIIIIATLLWLCLAVACDKAPRGIIGERQMARIVADLQLADAYVATNPDKFPTDSMCQALKQSIFIKHGVTPLLYDSSLVWYAHNMDAYTDVYDRAAAILNDRRNAIERESGLGNGRRNAGPPHLGQGGRRLYGSQGDTINLWEGPLQLTATTGLSGAFYPFDYSPANDSQPGDRYELSFKLNSAGARLDMLMAVDYSDGTTAIMPRTTGSDGWTTTTLQSDTARNVRRIYGYLRYTVTPAGTVLLDSIQLLRTRYSARDYASINVQRLIDRTGKQPAQATPASTAPSSATTPANSTTPASTTAPANTTASDTTKRPIRKGGARALLQHKQ